MTTRILTGNVSTIIGEAREGIRITLTSALGDVVYAQDGDLVLGEPADIWSGPDGALGTRNDAGTWSTGVPLRPGNYAGLAFGSNGKKRFTFPLAPTGPTDLAELIDEAAIVQTPDVVNTVRAMVDEVVALQAQLDGVSLTTSRDLALTDAGKMLTATGAGNITVTIPDDTTAFPVETIIGLWRIGSGTVTLAAAGGVTLVTTDSLTSLGPGATAVLYKIGANSWAASGYFI
jgi:hypothetical protein